MNVTYRVDKDSLYSAIEGRIDASSAAEAEEKIFSFKNENPGRKSAFLAVERVFWTSPKPGFKC